jgi:hypothetical protein
MIVKYSIMKLHYRKIPYIGNKFWKTAFFMCVLVGLHNSENYNTFKCDTSYFEEANAGISENRFATIFFRLIHFIHSISTNSNCPESMEYRSGQNRQKSLGVYAHSY